jgi:hypothetical protein
MAAPSAWEVHDVVKDLLAKGSLDFVNDSFVVRLYTSASDVNDPAEGDATAVTNELTTANGYTAGGISTTGSVSSASGVTTVDFADVFWTANTSGITARYAAVIDTTTTPDAVIAHCVLDSAPADVTAAAGKQFMVQFHPNGLALLV